MDAREAEQGARREEVLAQILGVLTDLPKDYDVGPITPATELGSIGIDSVNFIYLLDELRKTYDLRDLYTDLRQTGRPLAKYRVSDLADLVCAAVAHRAGSRT